MPHYISKEGQLGSLSAAITAGQTTLPINASEISRFDTVPSGSFRWGVIIDRFESGYARFEFFKEVGPSPSGNDLNVVRGQLGTTALAFPIGAGSPAQVQVRISDSIANLMAMVDGFGAVIQATAPTLTAFSPRNVILNPAVPITVALPTTDVWTGKEFRFTNLGTADITINASGGGAVLVLAAARSVRLEANQDTPTAAGHWDQIPNYLSGAQIAKNIGLDFEGGTAPATPSTGHVVAGAVTTDVFGVAKSAFRLKNDAGTVHEFGGGATGRVLSVGGLDSNSYIDGAGTSGADATVQTVKAVTLPADALNAVGRGIRIRSIWKPSTATSIMCLLKLNGLTLTSKIMTAANQMAFEGELHYIDATHLSCIVKLLDTVTGAVVPQLMDWNKAGFANNADQQLEIGQGNAAGTHITVYTLIVEQI